MIYDLGKDVHHGLRFNNPHINLFRYSWNCGQVMHLLLSPFVGGNIFEYPPQLFSCTQTNCSYFNIQVHSGYPKQKPHLQNRKQGLIIYSYTLPFD